MNKPLSILISIAILSFLIFRIGPSNIYNSLTQIKLLALLAVPLLFVLMAIGTYNVKILLNPVKKVNFFKLFKYMFVGWSLGLFTPGKIGEFTTSYLLLKGEKIPLGKGISILLLDKIITLITLFLLALLGFYLFLPKIFFFAVLAILILFLISLAVFFFTGSLRGLIKKYILRKYSENFTGFSKTFVYLLKKKKSLLLLNFIITFFKLFLGAAMAKIVFLALGYNIPIVFLVLIHSAVTISTLIPISFNGIGIMDAFYVFLLSYLSIGAKIVIAHNLFMLIMSYIVAVLIIVSTKINANKNNKNIFSYLKNAIFKGIIEPIKYRSKKGYNSEKYWGNRFRKYSLDFRGAGNEGKSEEENKKEYLKTGNKFLEILKNEGLDFKKIKVLEIGPGNGFYTNLLKNLGVKNYAAIDVTDVLFQKLRKIFPDFKFIKKDVIKDKLKKKYDLIIIIDVIQHIVGEVGFAKAMKNIKGALEKNGRIFLAPVKERTTQYLYYIQWRDLKNIKKQFPGYSFKEVKDFRDGSLLIIVNSLKGT